MHRPLAHQRPVVESLPAFGASFSCKPGQPMQRTDAEQIKVWR
ncbi:hypothetical protein QT383_19900 [Stenotrophomonas rhizophila]